MNAYAYLNEQKRPLILFALLSLTVLGTFLFARAALFIGLFIALNAFAGLILDRGKFMLRFVGIEFVTFTTILAGFAYGPLVGALIGTLGRLSEALSLRRSFSLAVTTPLYAALGIIAGLMAPSSFVGPGIALAVGYSFFASMLTHLILGGRLDRAILFTITQALFSAALIAKLGPILQGLM